jgi:hypothetical protein
MRIMLIVLVLVLPGCAGVATIQADYHAEDGRERLQASASVSARW